MPIATDITKIPREDISELQQISDLMHLFHHRNRNQHRRSIWYRHFSVFRKQLTALVIDLNSLNKVADTNLARTRKRAEDAQIIATTTKRIEFWRNVMVAKWQHAFSQLIADGRFSILGLVLVAALSQVCHIAGITAELEETGQFEVEKVLAQFGRETWGDGVAGEGADEAEDHGEVIKREDECEASKPEGAKVLALETTKKSAVSLPTQRDPADLGAEIESIKPNKKRTAESKTRKTKKKRKKGDAIDDIFG